jgi:hypothetical protein
MFDPRRRRICKICGTIWQPRFPIWAAILILLLGLFFLVCGAVYQLALLAHIVSSLLSLRLPQFSSTMFSDPTYLSLLLLLAAGLYLTHHGLGVLRGKKGKFQILEEGTPQEKN